MFRKILYLSVSQPKTISLNKNTKVVDIYDIYSFDICLLFVAINSEGREIFLRDIWPTREEIQAVERTFVIPSMFKEVYEKIEVEPAFNVIAA